MTDRPLVALRARRTSGKAHLGLPMTGSTRHNDTLCGRRLSDAEALPWKNTAPEDRCARCARRLAESWAQ